ncbi:MAG: hypothetical protein PHC71_01830 [Candidatus Omnitrophica bacterium]|nr:hypothetical protein [Candidatus Omnitrophota bacterium]
MSVSKLKVKAMLICDNVMTEQGSGKNSLLGVFENIDAKQFPVVHPTLCVYICFTEALGKYNFRLELVNTEDNQPVYPGSVITGVESSDIMMPHNLVFKINMILLQKPGKYEFRLFANEEICETSTINVRQI